MEWNNTTDWLYYLQNGIASGSVAEWNRERYYNAISVIFIQASNAVL